MWAAPPVSIQPVLTLHIVGMAAVIPRTICFLVEEFAITGVGVLPSPPPLLVRLVPPVQP